MTTSPEHTQDCSRPSRDDGPCWAETGVWRDCIDERIKSKNVKAECASYQNAFDKCVGVWRAEVGPDARIRGRNLGEPPRQCSGISCLVQKCLTKTQYNHIQCDQVTKQFKHCVKGLYGAEYVSD
jgi:hypothetical protein